MDIFKQTPRMLVARRLPDWKLIVIFKYKVDGRSVHTPLFKSSNTTFFSFTDNHLYISALMQSRPASFVIQDSDVCVGRHLITGDVLVGKLTPHKHKQKLNVSYQRKSTKVIHRYISRTPAY